MTDQHDYDVDAREFLADAGIDDPTPELRAMARGIAENIVFALANDPTLNDYDGSVSDIASERSSYLDVSDIAGSRSAMSHSHGMGETDSIEDHASAVLWDVSSNVANFALAKYQRAPSDLRWSEIPARAHGGVLIGRTADEGAIYVEVKVSPARDGKPARLSISGHTQGGSAGQIGTDPADVDPSPSYTREDIVRLFEIWDRWHLNDVRAYCPHQARIADRMGKRPHEIFTTAGYVSGRHEIPSYDAMAGKQMSRARNVCAVCDYAYGSAWLSETVPAEVLAFVARFTTAQDDSVAAILRTDNPNEPGGEWSVYEIAYQLKRARRGSQDLPVDLLDVPSPDDIANVRAAVGRLCPGGGRYVGGTSVYLYHLPYAKAGA